MLCNKMNNAGPFRESSVRLSIKIAVNKFSSPSAPITAHKMKMIQADPYTLAVGRVIPDIQLQMHLASTQNHSPVRDCYLSIVIIWKSVAIDLGTVPKRSLESTPASSSC